MESEMSDLREDIKNLVTDIALIKNILIEREELSDWAKEELAKAREESDEDHISLEDLKKEIENDL